MQTVDGTETLAAAWPTKLSYMSGSDVNLPMELLICWDNIASGIQKLLNTHSKSEEAQLEIVEYVRNDVAYITYPEDVEDDLPDMLAGPIYNKKVLRAFTSGEESGRKFYFTMDFWKSYATSF